MATFNTMLLITSSVTMVMSWASLKLNQFDKYKMYLGITIPCAIGFLFVKYFEYTGKFHHGVYPSSSTFMGIYFTLTGLHVLHIIGGLVVLIYLWTRQAYKMWKENLIFLPTGLKSQVFTGILLILYGFFYFCYILHIYSSFRIINVERIESLNRTSHSDLY